MNNNQIIRGMATANYWADDVSAAVEWYTKFLNKEPYFVRPSTKNPEYVEFRIGDYQDELGIISSKYRPETPAGNGGIILYWHVDDIEGALERAKSMGATEHQPVIPREAGFITASVIDPFGNIVGLMHNPHYLAILQGEKEEE